MARQFLTDHPASITSLTAYFGRPRQCKIRRTSSLLAKSALDSQRITGCHSSVERMASAACLVASSRKHEFPVGSRLRQRWLLLLKTSSSLGVHGNVREAADRRPG